MKSSLYTRTGDAGTTSLVGGTRVSNADERPEGESDRLDDALPKHKRFILPGGHPDAAHAHVARTIARRAERRMVALGDVDPTAMRLINRLSDYLFALARTINMRNRAPEVFWEPAPKAE